jgi:hypothetical protein
MIIIFFLIFFRTLYELSDFFICGSDIRKFQHKRPELWSLRHRCTIRAAHILSTCTRHHLQTNDSREITFIDFRNPWTFSNLCLSFDGIWHLVERKLISIPVLLTDSYRVWLSKCFYENVIIII